MDAIAAEMAELDAELHGHESGQRALDVSTHGRLVNRRLEAATELARVQQKLAPPSVRLKMGRRLHHDPPLPIAVLISI
jgi:hypothetical protein